MTATQPGRTPERVPLLTRDAAPPVALGAAALTTLAMHGSSEASLAALVERADTAPAARLFDLSVLHQLAFRPAPAATLQAAALAAAPCLRVARTDPRPPVLRVLALAGPGDLMANTPLDFITRHLPVQLDLLFLLPGRPLPDTVPDHDLLFCAATEPDPATFRRMTRLLDAWPRPVLNHPASLPLLARTRLPVVLAGCGGVCSPPCAAVDHLTLTAVAGGARSLGDILPGAVFPVLVRPHGSHAGTGLTKVDSPAELGRYAASSGGGTHVITAFVDYRSPDGLYRKSRVALIDGAPFLCHQAISSHWMVHYLNAGMDASAAKRAEEADAMAGFDAGFARRHRDALAELCRRLPFDCFSVDAAETPDGRLLVFEADTAAIIHLLEPADRYPYKHVQMARVFAAFGALLERRCVAPAAA